MFAPNAATTTAFDLAAASGRLLHASRGDADASDLFASLADLDEWVIDALGDDRDAARAFWVNVHDALAARGSQAGRVAGATVDRADVEHGLLRGGKWKYGLGYVPNPFLGGFVRRHRLDDPDPRVHLAIRAREHGIGPAGAFTAASVDAELTAVTAAYLDATVEYDADADVARVPRTLFWFRGDFGGREGVRSLLHRHDVIPAGVTPRLDYAASAETTGGSSDSRRDTPESTQ